MFDLQLVNDNKKFSLQLDVSHYKPEQLKVNLDGRKLTIEGNCEEEGEHGFSKRFVFFSFFSSNFSKQVLFNDVVSFYSSEIYIILNSYDSKFN